MTPPNRDEVERLQIVVRAQGERLSILEVQIGRLLECLGDDAETEQGIGSSGCWGGSD